MTHPIDPLAVASDGLLGLVPITIASLGFITPFEIGVQQPIPEPAGGASYGGLFDGGDIKRRRRRVRISVDLPTVLVLPPEATAQDGVAVHVHAARFVPILAIGPMASARGWVEAPLPQAALEIVEIVGVKGDAEASPRWAVEAAVLDAVVRVAARVEVAFETHVVATSLEAEVRGRASVQAPFQVASYVVAPSIRVTSAALSQAVAFQAVVLRGFEVNAIGVVVLPQPPLVERAARKKKKIAPSTETDQSSRKILVARNAPGEIRVAPMRSVARAPVVSATVTPSHIVRAPIKRTVVKRRR